MKSQTVGVYIISGLLVLILSMFLYFNNAVIGLEQNIEEATSSITIQEKRQLELITQLVQVVEAGATYEQSTLIEIAKLRTSATNGDIEQAMTSINVVMEAYPQLQANTLFLQLMTEMSISENLVAQYRLARNQDIKRYNTFVRKFPNRVFLSLSGYIVIDYQYLEFEDTELPDQLFSE